MPFLQKLVTESKETVSLAVLDGTSARIVQRVESRTGSCGLSSVSVLFLILSIAPLVGSDGFC